MFGVTVRLLHCFSWMFCQLFAHMRSPVEILTKIVCTSATSSYLICTQIRSSMIGRRVATLCALLLCSLVSGCISLSTTHIFVWQDSAMICFYIHKFIFSSWKRRLLCTSHKLHILSYNLQQRSKSVHVLLVFFLAPSVNSILVSGR